MRPKSLILLLLAIGCGLVASIGVSEMMDHGNEPAVETEPILVAMIDIERSTLLTPENVLVKDWPKSDIPEHAVRDLAEIEGQRPLHKIAAGLPIMASMIGGSTRPSAEIPEGHRVVPVSVTRESGLGLINPGDRVDVQVFVHKNQSSDIPRTMIKTFLEDVPVFAVDTKTRPDDEGEPVQASTISLLVTPDQGAKVALAAEIGKIRLVLRGLDDQEETGHEVQAFTENIFDDAETFDDGIDEERARLLAQLDEQRRQLELELAALRAKKGENVTWKVTMMHGNIAEVYEFTSDSSVPRKVSGSSHAEGGREIEKNSGKQDNEKFSPEAVELDPDSKEISESQIKEIVEKRG
ncbi:MAG: Flp pilus assembly protein CpaB [Planctomycetota bacterium]|nr:Flp pilus assembly protein CpaB [Planctomycetota bacterium]